MADTDAEAGRAGTGDELDDRGPYWRQVELGGNTGAAQRHTRSQQTRMALVEAAGALFAESDFQAVSLSMIAEKAGIPKGSLAFHFRTKTDIARAVIAEMNRRWETICGQTTDDHRGPPLDTLVAEAARVLRASLDDPLVLGGYRLSPDPAIIPDTDFTHHELAEQRIRHLLGDAASAEQLACGLDLDAAARVIAATITGVGQIHARHPSSVDLDTRLSEVWSMLLPALRTHAN